MHNIVQMWGGGGGSAQYCPNVYGLLNIITLVVESIVSSNCTVPLSGKILNADTRTVMYTLMFPSNKLRRPPPPPLPVLM